MTVEAERELTPEEAQALLPELKSKTEAWLGEAREIDDELRRFRQENELTEEQAFERSAGYRDLCIRRRRAHFSWGNEVFSMGMTPLTPKTGEVKLNCTDGTRYWKEGDEDYTFEAKEIEAGGLKRG